MRLLFDLVSTQPNITGKRHGGGRYGEIILLRMLERGIKLGVFYDSTRWINPEIKNACEQNHIIMHDIHLTSLENIIKTNGYTRFYSCLPGEFGMLGNCEIYGTIHGLREFETPFDNIFYYYNISWKEKIKFTIKKMLRSSFLRYKHQQYVKRYIKSKMHLITVSEHSRFALLSFFPEINDENICVFYSPNTSRNVNIERNGSIKRYFLLVSGNRWEKNNLRAIIAFDRLITYGRLPKDIKMIVTGTNYDSFRYKVKNEKNFEFLGYVDDDELECLYANAYLFVYPSLNEGFGYPPIEAMRYGIPVIASPLSSIAEICGGGALYFNPFSVEEIMNRMLMMMQSNIYQEYCDKAKTQYCRIAERQHRDLDGIIDYITKI